MAEYNGNNMEGGEHSLRLVNEAMMLTIGTERLLPDWIPHLP